MRLLTILAVSLLLVFSFANSAAADHHGDHQLAAADVEQSVPAEASADTETCGGGEGCCSACQIRKKYSKAPAEAAAAGCPCQRAKKAREAAKALKN